MRRTAILEGVRMMRFLDVFGRCERRELSRLEAAELLGVNERTLRRWCRRFEAEGEAGLVTSPFVTTRKQLESEIHCVSKTDVFETSGSERVGIPAAYCREKRRAERRQQFLSVGEYIAAAQGGLILKCAFLTFSVWPSPSRIQTTP